MSTLRTAITSHPDRSELLADLCDQVDPYAVSIDIDGLGPWRNHRRSWETLIQSGTEWGLVLEDDVEVIEGFKPFVQKMAAEIDPCVLCLFCIDSPKRREAVENGLGWLRFHYSTWGPAIMMPTTWAAEWLDWCERYVEEDYTHYDTRLTWWLQEHQEPTWVPVPNLVEHRDVESLMPWGGRRKSVTFDPSFSDFSSLRENPRCQVIRSSPLDSRYDHTTLTKE